MASHGDRTFCLGSVGLGGRDGRLFSEPGSCHPSLVAVNPRTRGRAQRAAGTSSAPAGFALCCLTCTPSCGYEEKSAGASTLTCSLVFPSPLTPPLTATDPREPSVQPSFWRNALLSSPRYQWGNRNPKGPLSRPRKQAGPELIPAWCRS